MAHWVHLKPLGVFLILCALPLSSSAQIVCPPIGCVNGAYSLSLNSPDLDGVYEFVSETLSVVKPKAYVERYTANEWEGLWFFHEGHFSETLMRRKRTPSDAFERGPRESGFIGRAGTYSAVGSQLEVTDRQTIYPAAVNRVRTFQYMLKDDTLTLTETLHPSVESTATGQHVVVLRRISK